MEITSFTDLLEMKRKEVFELYENKLSKNKKMTSDPNTIDFNSKKTINLINAALDKKLKSSKAYQKKVEKELLEKEI
jgi:hypothetical protein